MDPAYYRPTSPACPVSERMSDPVASLTASIAEVEATGNEADLVHAEREAVLFLRRRIKRLRDLLTPVDQPHFGPLGLTPRIDIPPTTACPVCLTQV